MRALTIIWVFLFACGLSSQALMGERYDGRWWKALSSDEKDGFLSGYFDCYIWDAKGSDYSNASITQEIQHITKYYNAHPDAEGTPVIDLLHKVAGQKRKSVEGERHGAYDGDYWRQSSHPERIAFIRGQRVQHPPGHDDSAGELGCGERVRGI